MQIAEEALTMESQFLEQEVFLSLLLLERRRTERSRNPFVLMLLRLNGILCGQPAGSGLVQEICAVLGRCTRESDIKGWYEEPSIIGVMFCESLGTDGKDVEGALFYRLKDALLPYFHSSDEMDRSVSFHCFPEERGSTGSASGLDAHLYPEIVKNRNISKIESCLKRTMDLAGGLVLLVGLFPLFALISAAIKLTSKGPVLFRQERVGQFGRKFTLLKFRTMINKCDTRAHQSYMRDFITGKIDACQPAREDAADDGKPVFKITNDSRVTAIGRFLRKTSLDELPQCFNVLRGEMSLVGPRPPIPYEVEIYDIWHRRRILEMKPGITGLWQVAGRSAMTFDESVRLDLRYTKEWSLWLDLKILLLTPMIVITRRGGY